MNYRRALTASAIVLLAVLAISVTSHAQVSPQMAVRIGGGLSEYDLSGTGTTGSATLGFEYPVAPFLSLTASTDYFSYSPQLSDESSHYLVPEVGVQAQLPNARLSPYLGIGGGYAWKVSGFGDDDLTLFGALGVKYALTPGVGLWTEGRVRSIDPWVGTTADMKIGISKSF